MLNFPFYSGSLLGLGFWFILLGSFGTICGLFFWFYKKAEPTDVKTILVTIVFSFFLIMGLFISASYLYKVYKFQNINIADISELVIMTSKGVLKSSGKKEIIISEELTIQKLLLSLQNCEEFLPNHEMFEDGYKINLTFKNDDYGKDFYISVYRKSDAIDNTTSVIPHFGVTNSPNLGNYKCPEFQSLVKKHVDPLFKK